MGLLPRILKLFLKLLLHPKIKMAREGLATYAVRRGTIGNSSSHPILIDDSYSLCKDEVGNVFAKFVGAQCGVKKRTIWVAKPIVTNFLGPNLVGDHLAKT